MNVISKHFWFYLSFLLVSIPVSASNIVFKGGLLLGVNMIQFKGEDIDLFWNSKLGTNKRWLGTSAGAYVQCIFSKKLTAFWN
jgi:hypothetical protein